MINAKSYNYLFYFLLSILVVVLLFVSNTLSISYKEALNVFENTSVLTYITKTSIYLFGQNDIALRLPFIVFYILSVLLMYKSTEKYFKYDRDRFLSIIIFMVLPGVLSASLLVNSAIMVTFFTLLYLYFFNKEKKHSFVLLFLYLFIDNSFAILYFAIFLFSLKSKDKKILITSLVLFSLSMYIYGFESAGKPKGYFLDTFAIYSTIFSPLLFVYFVYTIYRAGVKNEKTLTWYISSTALLLSLIFSLRQRIYIEDYAPYVVISLPYMLKTFYHSYRVRLKQFRKKHYISAILVFIMLFLNVILTIINKPLYLLIPNERKHFAYKYHFIKEIAQELKKRKINNVYTTDERLQLRLKYYGIEKGYNYFITFNKATIYTSSITVNYYGRDLKTLYIKKVK